MLVLMTMQRQAARQALATAARAGLAYTGAMGAEHQIHQTAAVESPQPVTVRQETVVVGTYSTADDVIRRYQQQVESANSPVLPEARSRFSEWIRDGTFASAIYGIPAAVADGLWDRLTPSSSLVDVPATALMIRSLTTYAPAITSASTSSASSDEAYSLSRRIVDRITNRVRSYLVRIAIPVLVDANRAAMEAYQANAERALPMRILAYVSRMSSYLLMAVGRTVARAIQWYSERCGLQETDATPNDEVSFDRILDSVDDDGVVGTAIRATTEQLHEELVHFRTVANTY